VTAHHLALWHQNQHVADLSYDPLSEDWGLDYTLAQLHHALR
jgi:hypothetical protein